MKINTRSNKKFLYITLLVTVVIASVLVYLYMKGNFDNTPPVNDVSQSEGINFNPPTEEEKRRADETKQRIEEREKSINDTQHSGSTQRVSPMFSYLGQYGAQIEVGSYVPGIYEDGGVCTAKFTKGDQSISKSVQAVKNVSSVDCPVISIPVERFPSKGVWSVVVSYDSSNAAGSSEAKTVEVR